MASLMHATLTQSLNYDPATGIFTWAVSNSNRVKIGDRAGVIATNGRRYINIGGEKHMAHRLAWFYVKGEWPEGDIKQKNGDFDDCSWGNLEDVSRSIASRSRALGGRNKSGYRGVSLNKRGRWQAFITRNYKQVNLGTFDTAELASVAYEAAALEMEPAVSLEEKMAAAGAAGMRRRLRVSWEKMCSVETSNDWDSFDHFCNTVEDVPPRHSILARNLDNPVGPDNFICEPDLSTGFDLSTREGRVAYSRAHRKANPNVYRDRDLRKNFGISSAQFDEMLAAQGGVCAICERPERAMRDGEPMSLAQDHDHATGKNRGILCGNCNKALGKFEDNPDFLRNAIVYLAKHAAPAPFVCNDVTRDWLHVATPGFES